MDCFLHLNKEQIENLRPLCYLIWWQTPDETLKWPERLIAQVMDRGLWPEWKILLSVVTKEQMGEVLKHALPGWFRPRSWTFWNLKCLGLYGDKILPVPARKFS